MENARKNFRTSGLEVMSGRALTPRQWKIYFYVSLNEFEAEISVISMLCHYIIVQQLNQLNELKRQFEVQVTKFKKFKSCYPKARYFFELPSDWLLSY